MTDTVVFQTGAPATPPNLTVVATDELIIATVAQQVQRVELVTTPDGTNGVIQPGDAANGLDVDVTRLPALPAGTNEIGSVRNRDGTGNSLSSTGGALDVNVKGYTGGLLLPVDTELPTAVALGDTMANPTAPLVGAAVMGWNVGTSQWQRITTGAPAGALAVAPLGTVHVDDNAASLSIDDGGNSITVDVGPATTGGLTTYHLEAAATTNAQVVKNSAGQLYGWAIYNNAATLRKVCFHNANSPPTAGAAIFFTIVLPPGALANVFSDIGIAFSTGIAITTVTTMPDNGATGVAIDDLNINLFYK